MPKTSRRSQIEDKKPAGREPAGFDCFGIQTANRPRSISPGSGFAPQRYWLAFAAHRAKVERPSRNIQKDSYARAALIRSIKYPTRKRHSERKRPHSGNPLD
jgi:hypothetical protein